MTGWRHSTSHKLEMSKSQANQWIKAMELVRRRLLQPSTPSDLFGSEMEQLEVDIHFCLVALLRFFRAIKGGASYLPGNQQLKTRIREFHHYIGIKQTMRNVGEHFDEYLEGRGRDRRIDTAGLQVWAMDQTDANIRFSWLGETFDLGRTMSEAEVLWSEFLVAYRAVIPTRD